MRAVIIDGPGEAGVLRLGEAPEPRPGPGDVLVAVAAAGLNFADVVMRLGETNMTCPYIPGVEGSGRVIELGPGVTDFEIGDRVAWAPVWGAAAVGSYAERIVVPAAQLLGVPDGVSLQLAAAVTLQGLTAHYLVTEQVPITSTTVVLVHAAAGGTGMVTVQWLKHLGATVIGTVSTDEKAVAAKAAGLDHAVVLATHGDPVAEVLRLTDGRGVDYIVDGVAGPNFRRNFAMLANRGRVTVFGRAGGLAEPFSPLELLPKAITVSGALMNHFLRSREEVLRKADNVWTGVREGWLDPRIHGVLPLADAADAHRMLESRRTIGKVVLDVGGDLA